MKDRIYFDHNATTSVWPEVVEAMSPFWRDLAGNPSSTHQAGVRAAEAIRRARREVGNLLGVQVESEIVFTSGGAESNNTAFRSALATGKGKRRIVTTTVEHSSVLKLARALQEEGVEGVYIPVDQAGALDLAKLKEAVTADTALVSVMMANNETGVIFPIETVGEWLRSKGVLFHVDAVQAVGKIPICLKSLAVDFLSLSGHKFGAPKGVGALFVRKGIPFRPFVLGGSQEEGRRAGTENVPGIVGLGCAADHVRLRLTEDNQKVREIRDYFENKVLQAIPFVEVNGDRSNRLPHTSNLAFQGVDAEALLILLDEAGVLVSLGSACLSGASEPSFVLTAMGFSRERAKSSIRFSLGVENTREEADQVVELLRGFVERLRSIQ